MARIETRPPRVQSPRAPGEKRGRTGSRSKRGPANRPFTEDTPGPIDVDRQQSTPDQELKFKIPNEQKKKKKRSEKAKHGGTRKGAGKRSLLLASRNA